MTTPPPPLIRTASLDRDAPLPEALLFEGGGTKSLAYAGVMAALERAHLGGARRLAGTSTGAQMAALAAFGYAGEELTTTMRHAPWDGLLDGSWGVLRDAYRLWRHFGLYRGDVLEAYLDEAFAKKAGG